MDYIKDIQDIAIPDLFEGMRKYIMTMCFPKPVSVRRGLQNRASLPPSRQYVIMLIDEDVRAATNVTALDINVEQGNYAEATARIGRAQLYFYGDYAHKWAVACESMTRTEAAVRLLADYNMQPLYAEGPYILSTIDGTQEFDGGHVLRFYFAYSAVTKMTVDYFTSVTTEFEDVDTMENI